MPQASCGSPPPHTADRKLARRLVRPPPAANIAEIQNSKLTDGLITALRSFFIFNSSFFICDGISRRAARSRPRAEGCNSRPLVHAAPLGCGLNTHLMRGTSASF